MLTIGTFLLLVSAIVGTFMIFKNPLADLVNHYNGRLQSEVSREIEYSIKEQPTSVVFAKGCKYALYILVGLFYGLVVEPMAVIFALVNDVGNPYIAYGMGVIVATYWIRTFLPKKKKDDSKALVVTEDGRQIIGQVVKKDEVIKISTTGYMLQRIIYALPTLYLWYLFFHLMGFIPEGF